MMKYQFPERLALQLGMELQTSPEFERFMRTFGEAVEDEEDYAALLGDEYQSIQKQKLEDTHFRLAFGHHLLMPEKVLLAMHGRDDIKKLVSRAQEAMMREDAILMTKTKGRYKFHCRGAYTFAGCSLPIRNCTPTGHHCCEECWENRHDGGYDTDEEDDMRSRVKKTMSRVALVGVRE